MMRGGGEKCWAIYLKELIENKIQKYYLVQYIDIQCIYLLKVTYQM